MIWISTALVALVLAVGYVIKKKKPSRNFVPIRVVRKLVKAELRTWIETSDQTRGALAG